MLSKRAVSSWARAVADRQGALVDLSNARRLLSIVWAGLVGEAAQFAFFLSKGDHTSIDRERWTAALQTRALTYGLSLLTTALLVYTTLHIYGASTSAPHVCLLSREKGGDGSDCSSGGRGRNVLLSAMYLSTAAG